MHRFLPLLFTLSLTLVPIAHGHADLGELVAHMQEQQRTLAALTERIDARATILVQSGKDSGSVRPYLAAAHTATERASETLASIDIQEFTRNPRPSFPGVETSIVSAAADLRSAKQSLTEAIIILKEVDVRDATSEAVLPEVQ